MKKIITLMLCLMLVMSLVACGGNKTAEATGDTSTQTEATTTPEESQEATETVDETAPEEMETTLPEEVSPTFDTSWASNDFEAMIPELPFTGWTVTEETDSKYELELGGLETAGGANTASGFEKDKDALITYLNALTAYGFTVEETGDDYEWLVTDVDGNTIEFKCGDGYCWVTFKKVD